MPLILTYFGGGWLAATSENKTQLMSKPNFIWIFEEIACPGGAPRDTMFLKKSVEVFHLIYWTLLEPFVHLFPQSITKWLIVVSRWWVRRLLLSRIATLIVSWVISRIATLILSLIVSWLRLIRIWWCVGIASLVRIMLSWCRIVGSLTFRQNLEWCLEHHDHDQKREASESWIPELLESVN